jgi:hypothetical protein
MELRSPHDDLKDGAVLYDLIPIEHDDQHGRRRRPPGQVSATMSVTAYALCSQSGRTV